MTQICLDCFHVVAILQGENSVGVSQVMDSGIRCPDFLCDLLKAQVCSLWNQMTPNLVSEYKSTFVIFFVLPAFPRRTCYGNSLQCNRQ